MIWGGEYAGVGDTCASRTEGSDGSMSTIFLELSFTASMARGNSGNAKMIADAAINILTAFNQGGVSFSLIKAYVAPPTDRNVNTNLKKYIALPVSGGP